MFYDMMYALKCNNENQEGDSPSRPGRQAAVFSSLLWPTAPWEDLTKMDSLGYMN